MQVIMPIPTDDLLELMSNLITILLGWLVDGVSIILTSVGSIFGSFLSGLGGTGFLILLFIIFMVALLLVVKMKNM